MSVQSYLISKTVLFLANPVQDCARRIVQLKLTTDRHEASRGLSATKSNKL